MGGGGGGTLYVVVHKNIDCIVAKVNYPSVAQYTHHTIFKFSLRQPKAGRISLGMLAMHNETLHEIFFVLHGPKFVHEARNRATHHEL